MTGSMIEAITTEVTITMIVSTMTQKMIKSRDKVAGKMITGIGTNTEAEMIAEAITEIVKTEIQAGTTITITATTIIVETAIIETCITMKLAIMKEPTIIKAIIVIAGGTLTIMTEGAGKESTRIATRMITTTVVTPETTTIRDKATTVIAALREITMTDSKISRIMMIPRKEI